ncbi:MAG: CHASE domain-containing protein, partial [Pseudomonadota bacterium]
MKLNKNQFSIIILAFFASLGAGIYLTHLNDRVQSNQRDRLVRDVVFSQAAAIEKHLSRAMAATYILAQEVRRNRGDFPHFEDYAQQVLDSVGGISNLQLAPAGVISHIHPLVGNEKAIGHNILVDDKRRNEAHQAIEKKQLTLAGPFTLIQGGIGVIGRNPVFIKTANGEEFWGFVSALVFLDDLLSSTDLSVLESTGYSYSLSRQHPDTGEKDVFARSKSALSLHAQRWDIDVYNAMWHLSMSSTHSHNRASGYAISFLFSMLQLRSNADPEVVVATRSALVQRDADV